MTTTPLLIVYGSETVYALPLVGETTWTLGRSSENTIVLRDQGVSRQHAYLKSENGEIWLVDLSSRNGVWLNGERLQREARLVHGDRFTLGQTHLEFQYSQFQPPGFAPEPVVQADLVLLSLAGTRDFEAEIWRELLSAQGIKVWEAANNPVTVLEQLQQQGQLPSLVLMAAMPNRLMEVLQFRQSYPQLPLLLLTSLEAPLSSEQEQWATDLGVTGWLSTLPGDDLAAQGVAVAARLRQVLKHLGWGPLQEDKLAATLLNLQTRFTDDTPSQVLSQFIVSPTGDNR